MTHGKKDYLLLSFCKHTKLSALHEHYLLLPASKVPKFNTCFEIAISCDSHAQNGGRIKVNPTFLPKQPCPHQGIKGNVKFVTLVPSCIEFLRAHTSKSSFEGRLASVPPFY